jgi:N-methylhydantoinase A/oxoprolinase/acetone carboxylase beta subunit
MSNAAWDFWIDRGGTFTPIGAMTARGPWCRKLREDRTAEARHSELGTRHSEPYRFGRMPYRST